MSFRINYKFTIYNRFDSRNEDLDFQEKKLRASPGNEPLRKLQVIDTFLPAAIDCVTYLFSPFTLILIVVYW